ncbi:mechanosensitive ion channel protein MscS [Halobacteriales archaeon QS_1_68_20]|nr:MAG: mechanosensitive ion channel protein MscS [Halobacteriales archaeon QS_1_68_20]
MVGDGLLAPLVDAVPIRYWIAGGVLLAGLLVGLFVGKLNRQLLSRIGIGSAVEGTAFERTMQDFGTSTVSIIARLSTYVVWGLALIVALTLADLWDTNLFWEGLFGYLPQVFVAVTVLVVGVVVGDKVEVVVSERLRGYKAPQIGFVAVLAKYTVVFVAALIALGQLGIAIAALLILLGVYVFGVVFLAAVAFRDMLASGAAGVYLLLNQPYGIGDRIRVGNRHGIVQEVDVFVTTVETDNGTEYVIPNRKVFEEGVARIR